MKYGSVCSGVEAATVAWHPLGWQPQFFSEIENFPRAVLSHHYPEVPLHGDFTTIGENEYGAIDLLVGGTPCQSFSIAGLRGGMADDRGNLALEFLRLAKRKKPRWILWENVPGVLSSNGGKDFASFLHGLAECGYGFAYRVLNAQYFGVPQRRRRVFVVGYLGDWRPAAAVLFERESLQRDITPRQKERQNNPRELAKCLTARGAGGLNHDNETATFVCTLGHSQSNGLGISQTETANTLEATSSCNQAIAFKVRGGCEGGGKGYLGSEEATFTVSTGQDQHLFFKQSVRRLTPIECERLQGFPDNYTFIKQGNGKPAADAPRYKAMGNSMAVPVMRWLGERIDMVDKIIVT